MIPQSFIDNLLQRIDIVELVGRYVPLKKGGANQMGLCPFHNEKSPSFTVSPTKQFYHCFGCGAHGTAIGFLMEYSGLSFVESVKDLAQGVGLEVPDERAGEGPRAGGPDAAALVALMERANRFYRDQLKVTPVAVDYLKGRGLSGEIAARFGLGYAPDEWNALQGVFGDEYGAMPMLDTGLVIESEKGSRYDRFRGRVTFPIRNTKGQIIGFGGRVIGAGEPKYLNSPETPLFEKGRELYGLFEARREIRAAGRVLVVEGYMDVVALAQHGVGYAVASLGTACTPAHVQKLTRQADRIVFCFDGDAAGRRAAWRALENSLSLATDDKVFAFLFLPAEHDPDTFIRERGQDAFEAEEARAMPLSRFLIAQLESEVDLSSAEGRAGLVAAAKPHLQRIAAPGLRLGVVKGIAELAGMTAQEVERLAELKPQASILRTAPARLARTPVTPLDEQILRLLLGQPGLAMLAGTEDARHAIPAGSLVLRLIDAIHAAGGASPPAALREAFRDTEDEPYLKKAELAALEFEQDAETIAAEYLAALDKLQSTWRWARIKALEADAPGDPVKFAELRALHAEERAAHAAAEARRAA